MAYAEVAPSYLVPAAAAAERIALATATVHVRGDFSAFFCTDCLSAAKQFGELRQHSALRCVWGARWRQVNPRHVAGVRHVRAHQALPPRDSCDEMDVATYASSIADR